MSSKITFYGGVHEIGGNKFVVEDKGTRIFLDFGVQMGTSGDYYAEFLKPRNLNGMGDLFEFGLLPRLNGLYRTDYSNHTKYGDSKVETLFDAVLLTHSHLDHAGYIHYLRPEIPIYCSEATKMIMQALQDTGTGTGDEYINYKESFKIYDNRDGNKSRAKDSKHRQELNRTIITTETRKKFHIDSIEVEPISIDHSLPGVSGYILHTSNGSIGYTADIRLHGRRKDDSLKFITSCHDSDIDYLLCEGTRINEDFSATEMDLEGTIRSIVNSTKNLVICTYPIRDLDRLLSFYNAAKECNRDLVIDLKQAYILKLFQGSEHWKRVYPRPDDKRIKIIIPRKGWGLIGEDVGNWTDKIIAEDYKTWEREFFEYPNQINYKDVNLNQSDLVFYCGDYQLQQLIDIKPEKEGSSYIRSLTEPFDDEMELKEERVKNWISHFNLLAKEEDWNRVHVSGHGDGSQIKYIVDNTKAKKLIPIHTTNENYFKKWHNDVIEVGLNDILEI